MKTVIKDSSAQYVLRCRGGRGLRNNPMTVNIFGNVLHMSLRESAFQMISQVKSISKKHNVLMRQTPLKSNSFLALASPVWSLPNRTPKTSLHLVQFSASPESVHPTRHSGKHPLVSTGPAHDRRPRPGLGPDRSLLSGRVQI